MRLTGWISLQSKGLSRVFSNTTVQKHQFFGAQLSLQYIEVGGKDKTFDQIADLPDSYILADSIEFPIGKKLPLWLVGMEY